MSLWLSYWLLPGCPRARFCFFSKPCYFSCKSCAEMHLRLPLPLDILLHLLTASSVAGVHASPATCHLSIHTWLFPQPSAFAQPSLTSAPDQSNAKGWNNEINNDFKNNLQTARTTRTNSLQRKSISYCFLYWTLKFSAKAVALYTGKTLPRSKNDEVSWQAFTRSLSIKESLE